MFPSSCSREVELWVQAGLGWGVEYKRELGQSFLNLASELLGANRWFY